MVVIIIIIENLINNNDEISDGTHDSIYFYLRLILNCAVPNESHYFHIASNFAEGILGFWDFRENFSSVTRKQNKYRILNYCLKN